MTRMVKEAPREAAHEERTTSLGADPHPPPCDIVAFSSLEPFHPLRSNRPADQDRLTQREASNSIVAMAVEEIDLRGRREGASGRD